MQKTGFQERHQWDSAFWLAFVASSWLAVAMGFGEPIAERYAGQAPYAAPPILVVHVFVYFGWLLLLTLQVSLVNRGRPDLHRLAGMGGALLAVLVIATGLGAEIYSQRFWAKTDSENVRFFTFPLYVLIAFAACSFLAIRDRGDSPRHKRLMYLATAAVMGGPYQRWWGSAIDTFTGTGPFNSWAHLYSGMNALLIAAACYDWLTRGMVHRVLRNGILLLVTGQIAAMLLWYSDWWPHVTRTALGIAEP
ncbi:hypothetical protein [Novosphingobium sp.]|uniref:hypothetical protein n=1 Tax=Novosphingobium sp. TaxID=1874826 RepID=UPI0025FF51EB|nr:hypothetical protein [Novosphingobium sp.]